MSKHQFRPATDDDLRMPEFKGKSLRIFEVNEQGQIFLKPRWEHALRQIALHLELPSAVDGEAQEILRDFYLKMQMNASTEPVVQEEIQSRYPLCDDGSQPD